MAHVAARRFTGGWWPMGPKEEGPPGTLRRATGVRGGRHADGAIRSRFGCTLIRAVDAHSLYRFNDLRFYGVGTTLQREGTVVKSGLDGKPLDFLKMPPAPGMVDALYVTGGGQLFKVDQNGVATNWGIVAPPDGFAATFIPAPTANPTQADNGAGALKGIYKYRVTFRDSVTGQESSVNPADVTTANITNRQIRLSAIPTGPAPTDSRRVYRTLGGGALFFLVGTIADNVATTFDDNTADGAVGAAMAQDLSGTYQYRVTFKNATGGRSNGNPTPVVIMEPTEKTKAIYLTGLPLATDPQVTGREIWRTVGNGNIFFLVDTIEDNTTTTYLDTTLDVNLEEEELPDDNDPPFTFPQFQTVAGPHDSRAWWISSNPGERGRLYYSPVGRPEAVEDFIEVSTDDDPLQAALEWGPAFFAFSEAGIFEILGSGPYISRAVPNCPGVVASAKQTVVATPYGIVYFARDGVRLFNGQTSRLVGMNAVGLLFHGEALENVAPFEAIVAEYYEDAYLISDGVETLGLDLSTITWRVYGLGVRALYSEKDTGVCQASTGGRVVALDAEGATDDAGTPIPLAVEWPSIFVDLVYPGTIQFVLLDFDSAGQVLTPTLLLDSLELPLPAIVASGRQTIEWAVGRSCRRGGLRLVGSLTQPVTIYGVDGEFYKAEPDASLAATLRAQQKAV